MKSIIQNAIYKTILELNNGVRIDGDIHPLVDDPRQIEEAIDTLMYELMKYAEEKC